MLAGSVGRDKGCRSVGQGVLRVSAEMSTAVGGSTGSASSFIGDGSRFGMRTRAAFDQSTTKKHTHFREIAMQRTRIRRRLFDYKHIDVTVRTMRARSRGSEDERRVHSRNVDESILQKRPRVGRCFREDADCLPDGGIFNHPVLRTSSTFRLLQCAQFDHALELPLNRGAAQIKRTLELSRMRMRSGPNQEISENASRSVRHAKSP